MSEPNTALDVRSVNVKYGGALALSDVNVSVPEGSVVALVGNNGAGKSTLLNAVVGLVKTSHGSISAFGQDVTNRGSAATAQARIALVPEGRHMVSSMTVMDNLKLGYRRHPGHSMSERLEFVAALFPEIEPHLNRYAGLLSGGQQQMVAISRALMSAPRLLLLDEPGLGLAPQLVKRVFSALAELAKEDLTVMIAEQLANAVFEVCEFAYVIGLGSVIASGTPLELRESGALHEAYFARGRQSKPRAPLSPQTGEATNA
jgi:branched-chain amino acid transport system ATP-binding protein